jgi:hypothetical protein
MEDVLAVYQRPYDPLRPVVCFDECSKELRSTPRGSLAAEPGQVEREDYEYAREGTCNLFLTVEPLAGRRRVRVTERRTAIEFAEQLRLLVDVDYPHVECVVLVIDNLNTHSPASLYERFTPEEARRIAERIEWHYTPEHGSWLNIAEIELSVLSRQCLKRRLPTMKAVQGQIMPWQTHRNNTTATINWQFTTAEARTKLRRLYPQTKVCNSS